MKKNIFYQLKSIQEHCLTFSCYFKAGFSSLGLKTSVNRLSNLCLRFWHKSLAFPLILAAILMTDYTVNAQNIQGVAPVLWPKGGFAVDGNVFAKFPGDDQSAGDFLFENQSVPVTTNPGGIFVPSPPAYNYPDGPLPTPGVTGVPGTFYVYPNTTFFRDNITNNDPTTFTSSNKINDAVSSYTWGAGSSPNKNEIQNAIAHFTYGDPVLGGVATDLWMIFAADREVTEGSSYIDFEILQKSLTMNPNGTFSSAAGTPSGRTVGDLLVTIEFTQGGDFANVVVRRWGGSAYSEPITPPAGTLYGTNNTGQTIVPYPIYGQDPISTNPDLWAYEANQWAEGAVNVTSFFGNDPCFVISTLFVRTRTSGSSGQSELKDFPGAPFQLNLNFLPDPPTTTSAAICGTGGVVNLSASGCPGGTLKWYDAATGGNQVATGPTFSPNISQTTTYWVSCTSATGCEGPRAPVTGTVNPNPDITVQNLTACETGETGAASVDLAGAILTNPDTAVITFHNSLADAQNEVNAVSSPTSVTVASSPRTFWIRAEVAVTNCYSTASFTVTITDNPDITVQNLTACETGVTGAASVALTGAILTNPDAGVITFYSSLADAQNEVNGVTSPTSVTVASSPRTFWIRAEAGTTNCYSTASFTVTVTDNPDITIQNLTACETGATGAASVALTGAILTNPDGGVITFYNSLADAQNEVNGVISPTSVTVASSPRTFWIRAEAGTTNCYSTASFTVNVTDNPDITAQNIAACEIGTTGAASMDLTNAILTNPDGGVITFYNSLADAQNEANAVSSPTSVTVASSPRTFWIRAEAGTTNCYSTASFTATITDEPDITVQNLTTCETGTTGAASVALTGAILTNPDGGVITFHNSLADAQNDANAVASPTSVTLASSPRTFWVRAEAGTCYSTTSFTVTVTDNPDITVQNLTACETGTTGSASMDLTTAILTNPDGGVITFYDSLADAQNEANAVSSPTSVTVASSPRTFWIRAEAGTTNCYSTTSFTVTVTDNPDVTTMNLSNCESGTTGAVTFDLDNGVTGADGGTISFHTSQANADTGSSPIAGKDAYNALNGVTTIYVRSANGSCFGTASFTITVNPNPELTIHNPETVCEGVTVDLTAAAVTSGSTLEGGVLSYWTDAAATLPLATPSAVLAGTYYIKALTTSDCMDIKPVIVTDQPCGGALCTYTQGAYGNIGGIGCAEGVKYTTIGLIDKALASYGGTMVVGSGSNTISISSATCVIAALPGGGGSYKLSGASNICSLPSLYLKKGRINNTLLAQTITLGLNLGIDSDLGDFVLQAGTLAIASPLGGCGSDTPMPRSCSEEGYTPVINEYKYVAIPAVVDLLPVKTVQGLYDLANVALGGGVLPNGVTLSALASAVDLINNAFDECKIPMGYEQTPLVCNTSDPQGFVAFEVPIVNNQLIIKYKFSYLSEVTIDVYDTTTGNKVFSKADNNSYLDKEVKLDYNFNSGTQKVYIVRLTTKLGHSEQKVISAN